MSAVEVEILDVLVQPGQQVEAGTPIAEAASDKVDFTIESDQSGVVTEVVVTAGQTCAMGSVIARIEPRRDT
jgi:pyruvate/2-oxoglutarate dehydrogenase complex dihydrolipoamide acyltransferase (E2) component